MLHNSNKEIILKNEVQENTLAIYLEDEQINYIPEKDSGYTLDLTKSSCTNGVTIGFDYNTWSVKTNYSNYTNPDNTRVKCSLYFRKMPLVTEYILSLVDSSDELAYDETADNNLRYIGTNPNNYVWFNEELWRIIGVMNNIDDGTGKKETRVKMIRDESIGMYSWDNNGEYGINDWSVSALQQILNSGVYWTKSQGTCPYGNNSSTTLCDFSNTGFTDDAKRLVSDAAWSLNGLADYAVPNAIVEKIYTSERFDPVPEGNAEIWVGKVALMYPSDYGYATSGGNNKDRSTCLAEFIYNWGNPENSDCIDNNWLNGLPKWTLTLHSRYTTAAFCVSCYRPIDSDYSSDTTNHVFPTIYLRADAKIESGSGAKEQPYILGL